MQIVLESSAIVAGDWHLKGEASQELLAAATRGDIELLVPQVVFDEVVNLYKEKMAPEASWGYSSELRRTLLDAGARLLELPEVSHRRVVERALARRPPFDSKGRQGYRDVLIWHNVLEVATSDQMVILVTKDGIFEHPDHPEQLNPDLADELMKLGLAPNRVRPVRTVKDAVYETIQPTQKVLADLRDRLASDESWRRELFARLQQLAEEEADYVDADVDVGLGIETERYVDEVIEEEFEYIDDFARIAIADAVPLNPGRLVLDLWLSATVFYNVDVVPSMNLWDAPSQVAAEFVFYGDDRMARLGGFDNVILVFEAIYEPSTDDLSDLELRRMTTDFSEPRPHHLPRERRRPRAPVRPKPPREVGWQKREKDSPTRRQPPTASRS
jgi:predicted nucleic acid-binding protein